MAVSKNEMIVRRNTAIAATGVLTQPCAGMLADSVPVGSYLFSFDMSRPEYRGLVFDIDDDGTFESDDYVAKPFPMVNWAIKKIVMPDNDTGEPVVTCRTVIIDLHGDTIAFVSSGVLLSLDLIRMYYGDGPYNPPLQVVVKVMKTNRGFRMYKLKPFEQEPSASK